MKTTAHVQSSRNQQHAERIIAVEADQAVGLEQYYSEAGPDYAAWSQFFNIHFGYFRWGMNPFRREFMLEQMNLEVLDRLEVAPAARANIVDLGCGLSATMRRIAQQRPLAHLTGVTLVPWQVEQARTLNAQAGVSNRVQVVLGDYQNVALPSSSYDAVYALESSCHAQGASKAALLTEAHRLLAPGGRIAIADGFLCGAPPRGVRGRMYRKLCKCWVIEELGQLDAVLAKLKELGFHSIRLERIQLRVAASVMHVPWVTLKFLITDVVFGKRKMTQARWNNVLAPSLLPWVSVPFGPMGYCMISAVKG